MLVVDGISYGLSAADLADRKAFINASEAPTIVAGEPEAVMKLWREKVGQAEPEDLSGVMPVQLGIYTESFNCAWFERVSGLKVTDRQRVIKAGFLRATLDGMTEYQGAPCVWEAKHISAFSKVDDAVQRYFPQVFVQMHLSGARQAILSILHGTLNYEWVHVEFDEEYWRKVLARLEMFHEAVMFEQPPHDMAPLEAPKPTTFRAYDMTGQNEWASHAADWLASKSAAETFKAAEKNIKSLVPEDASDCTGHGITVKRSKAGALTIKGSKK